MYTLLLCEYLFIIIHTLQLVFAFYGYLHSMGICILWVFAFYGADLQLKNLQFTFNNNVLCNPQTV